MDIFDRIIHGSRAENDVVIRSIDMHTSGEATRIILPLHFGYYKELVGSTLLQKRAYARRNLDWLRERLMREPRGHTEMYGAILVPETELTQRGEADVGVLFCHNEGYSTMCGHATIAIGRFLVDTQDESVFPRRKQLKYCARTQETIIRLHAPCGPFEVRVPTTGTMSGPRRSDPTRRVRFTSVPSFVSATNVAVSIPHERIWTALNRSGRTEVVVDVAFGGAYYVVVDAAALGFTGGIREHTLAEFSEATKILKDILKSRSELYSHPSEEDLEYLYGIIVSETLGDRREMGLCFFANQQIDRSPTGSGVCARIALAVEKGMLAVGEEMIFESVVSMQAGEGAGFIGKAVDIVDIKDRGGTTHKAVRVCVEGQAYYTGAHSFVVEDGDTLPHGFQVNTAPA